MGAQSSKASRRLSRTIAETTRTLPHNPATLQPKREPIVLPPLSPRPDPISEANPFHVQTEKIEDLDNLRRNFEKLQFEITTKDGRVYRKDNELLSVAAKRAHDAQLELSADPSEFGTNTLSTFSAANLETLLNQRRTDPATWTRERLASQYGLKEDNIGNIFKYLNTPEPVFSSTDAVTGIWVEDLPKYRKAEVQGKS
ncbi:hypothetical protein BJ742DRAFT_789242 [Cladochytrium replicatum]|nr:hypothetical protein BJ742DRAFT_789242 [Cladochytrium replicatum]